MQGLFCSHLHALPLTPSAPETPKISCLLSPSALLLPYLLHAPGKAACHYRSSRSQQSCHLQGSDALSQHQLADGQECAGISLCRKGVRNNEWPRPLPWEHFCGTGQHSRRSHSAVMAEEQRQEGSLYGIAVGLYWPHAGGNQGQRTESRGGCRVIHRTVGQLRANGLREQGQFRVGLMVNNPLGSRGGVTRNGDP